MAWANSHCDLLNGFPQKEKNKHTPEKNGKGAKVVREQETAKLSCRDEFQSISRTKDTLPRDTHTHTHGGLINILDKVPK